MWEARVEVVLYWEALEGKRGPERACFGAREPRTNESETVLGDNGNSPTPYGALFILPTTPRL